MEKNSVSIFWNNDSRYEIINNNNWIFYLWWVARVWKTPLLKDIEWNVTFLNWKVYVEKFRNWDLGLKYLLRIIKQLPVNDRVLIFDDFDDFSHQDQKVILWYVNEMYLSGFLKKVIFAWKPLYEKITTKIELANLIKTYHNSKSDWSNSILVDDKIHYHRGTQNVITIIGPVWSWKSTLIRHLLNNQLQDFFKASETILPIFLNVRDFVKNDWDPELDIMKDRKKIAKTIAWPGFVNDLKEDREVSEWNSESKIHQIDDLLEKRLEDLKKNLWINCRIKLELYNKYIFVDWLDEVDISLSKLILEELNKIWKYSNNLVVILSRQLEYHDLSNWSLSSKYIAIHKLEYDEKVELIWNYLKGISWLDILTDKIVNDYHLSELSNLPWMLVNICHFVKTRIKCWISPEDIFVNVRLWCIYQWAIDYVLSKHESFKQTDNLSLLNDNQSVFSFIAWLSIKSSNDNSISEENFEKCIAISVWDNYAKSVKNQIIQSSFMFANSDNTFSFLSLSFREYWLSLYFIEHCDNCWVLEIFNIRDNNPWLFYSDTFKQTLVHWFDTNPNPKFVKFLIREIAYLNKCNELVSDYWYQRSWLPFDDLNRKWLYFIFSIFDHLPDNIFENELIWPLSDEISDLINSWYHEVNAAQIDNVFIDKLIVSNQRMLYKLIAEDKIKLNIHLVESLWRNYTDKLIDCAVDFIYDDKINFDFRIKLLSKCADISKKIRNHNVFDSFKSFLSGNTIQVWNECSVYLDWKRMDSDWKDINTIALTPWMLIEFCPGDSDQSDCDKDPIIKVGHSKTYRLSVLEEMFSSCTDIYLRLEYLNSLIWVKPDKYIAIALSEIEKVDDQSNVNVTNILDKIVNLQYDMCNSIEDVEYLYDRIESLASKCTLLYILITKEVKWRDKLIYKFVTSKQFILSVYVINFLPSLLDNYKFQVEQILETLLNYDRISIDKEIEIWELIWSSECLTPLLINWIESGKIKVNYSVFKSILFSFYNTRDPKLLKYIKCWIWLDRDKYNHFVQLQKVLSENWPANLYKYLDPLICEKRTIRDVNKFILDNNFDFTMTTFNSRWNSLWSEKEKMIFYKWVREIVDVMLWEDLEKWALQNLLKLWIPIWPILSKILEFELELRNDFELTPEYKLVELINDKKISNNYDTKELEFFNDNCKITVIKWAVSHPGIDRILGEENDKYLEQVFKLIADTDKGFGLETTWENDFWRDFITELLGTGTCKVYVVLVGEVVIAFNIVIDVNRDNKKIFYSYLLGSHHKFAVWHRLIEDFMNNIYVKEWYSHWLWAVNPYWPEVSTYFRYGAICTSMIRRPPRMVEKIKYFPKWIHADRLFMEFHLDESKKWELRWIKKANLIFDINDPKRELDTADHDSINKLEKGWIVSISVKKFKKNKEGGYSGKDKDEINDRFDRLIWLSTYLFNRGFVLFSYMSWANIQFYFRKDTS